VEREFNDEYSEILIYDNGEFYKYFRKYEETGITDFNCTKTKAKTALTLKDEPFNFVLIAENATYVGSQLFHDYHAEAFKWEDRKAYKPIEVDWILDKYSFGPDFEHLLLMRYEEEATKQRNGVGRDFSE